MEVRMSFDDLTMHPSSCLWEVEGATPGPERRHSWKPSSTGTALLFKVLAVSGCLGILALSCYHTHGGLGLVLTLELVSAFASRCWEKISNSICHRITELVRLGGTTLDLFQSPCSCSVILEYMDCGQMFFEYLQWGTSTNSLDNLFQGSVTLTLRTSPYSGGNFCASFPAFYPLSYCLASQRRAWKHPLGTPFSPTL